MTKMKRDDVVVASMLTLTLGLVVACGAAGSTYLLGAFVGGYAFAAAPNAKDAWAKLRPPQRAARVDLLPLRRDADPARGPVSTARARGLGIGYAVPAVLGKLATGAFVRDVGDAAVVGWAMVGRGELGFVMAREALDEGLFGDTPYVAWACGHCSSRRWCPRCSCDARWSGGRRRGDGRRGDVGAAEDGADAVEIGRHDVA